MGILEGLIIGGAGHGHIDGAGFALVRFYVRQFIGQHSATLTVDGNGTASGTYGAKLSELTVDGLTAKLGPLWPSL